MLKYMLDVLEEIGRSERLRKLDAEREYKGTARAALELSDAELLDICDGGDHSAGGAIGSGAAAGALQGIRGVLEPAGSAGSSSAINVSASSCSNGTAVNFVKVEGEGSATANKEGPAAEPCAQFQFRSSEAKENFTEAASGAIRPAFARENGVDESAQAYSPINIDGATINGTDSPLHVDLIWSNNKPPQLIHRPARSSSSVAPRRAAVEEDGAPAPVQPKRRRLARKQTKS